LPDHLKFFQGHFVFLEMRRTTVMGVRRGGKTFFCPHPWKLGLKANLHWGRASSHQA